MKYMINKFMKFALVAVFALAGATYAHAASFVSDPSTQGNGVTSIGHGYYDANDANSISVSIPDADDSEEFYVFLDYQNASSVTLTGVRAYLSYSGTSTVTFTGKLTSSNGGTITDDATLTGLPSSYEIELISAYKVNTHGDYCGSAYQYNTAISGLMSSNGAAIADLDTVGDSSTNGYTGACSQGHVVAKLRVTNTMTPGYVNDTVDVNTLNASNVGETSATLNGDMIIGGPADLYWFVLSSTDDTPECDPSSDDVHLYSVTVGSSSNPSFSLHQSGLETDTEYHYQACVKVDGAVYSGGTKPFTTGTSSNNGDTTVTTKSPYIDGDDATLRGEIEEVDETYELFFVFDDNSDVNCDETSDRINVESTSGDTSFSYDKNNLDDGTYYYRACAENNDGDILSGDRERFTIGESDGDIDIRTLSYDDLGTTYADLCGDLRDDGGDSSIRTNIEVRPASGGSWDGSTFRQRGEGEYCVTVNGLTPNTRYQYRACTDDGDCGDIRYFITNGGQVYPLNVNTLGATMTSGTSAVLRGSYQGSSVEPTRVWFQWGTTQNSLTISKQVFTKTAAGGEFTDTFSGLRSCRTYYYRAVAQNSTGIKYGNVYSLTTSCVDGGGVTVITQPRVEVVEQVEETTIDLDSLGLGLSLLRLDIDDEQDSLFRDQSVTYEVRWENISTIDLDTIDLKVTIPEEIAVTGVSRGRFDADQNILYFTIDTLDAGEDGSLTINGIVTKGTLGDVITAEASAAYNNPVNDAQENATDYDIDDFVLNTNFGTASVFGLSNITFLGWLTILLGLLIIFLIARWLYLEREELRAQAYANGYRPMLYSDPRYDAYGRGATLGYDQGAYGYDPRRGVEAPQAQQAPQAYPSAGDDYQPYRPDRR